MSQIFISHAVADQKLARLLTNFLKEAIGVPQDAIFCSSVTGHGIPLGDDFNAYIKDQIQNPRLVVLLMTPAYMESWFCLMELGAAWAKSHRTIPVVVPPVSFSAVTRTLGSKQAWEITQHERLIDFREEVKGAVASLEKRSEHIWEEKRSEWIDDLKKTIEALPPAKKVNAADHRAVIEKLEKTHAEVQALEKSKAVLEARNEQLKTLKDASAVKAWVASAPGMEGVRAQFDTLLEAVHDAVPAHISKAVVHHIIMDHFDKASSIDWYSSDAGDFSTAMKYAVIDFGN